MGYFHHEMPKAKYLKAKTKQELSYMIKRTKNTKSQTQHRSIFDDGHMKHMLGLPADLQILDNLSRYSHKFEKKTSSQVPNLIFNLNVITVIFDT